eukprot:scaffold329751_cov63-Tisochrysis_lutea.AAC.1
MTIPYPNGPDVADRISIRLWRAHEEAAASASMSASMSAKCKWSAAWCIPMLHWCMGNWYDIKGHCTICNVQCNSHLALARARPTNLYIHIHIAGMTWHDGGWSRSVRRFYGFK